MNGEHGLTFWVDGTPVAQGSMRSPKAGVVLHNSDSLSSWRDAVAWKAKDQWRGRPLLDGPVRLTCAFVFERPKKKTKHVWWRETAPDLDKLIRAVGDALEGVVLSNDARIVQVTAQKKYVGEPPLSRPWAGAYIDLETLS